MLLKKQVNLYRMGEQDLEIDRQRQEALQLLNSYFRSGAGTKDEKAMMQKVLLFVDGCKSRQEEMREEISNYLQFTLIEEKKLKRRVQKQGHGEQEHEEEQEAT
jgi:hypothetical protein